MKCEKCNNKDAVFYYSCNINGEKSERHLCEDCAREEGFGEAFNFSPASMFNDMVGSMFSDFFAPTRSLFPTFGSFGMPMRSMMAQVLPRFGVLTGESEQTQEKTDSKIPDDAGEEIKTKRKVEQLRHEMKQAVKAEDFEKAAKLRDEIKALGA